MLFSASVRLFWPHRSLLDEEERTERHVHSNSMYSQMTKVLGTRVPRWEAKSWWFGNRRNSYVGIYCSDVTTADTSAHKDSVVEMTRGAPKIPLVVRQCEAKRQAWVCVVGRRSGMQGENTRACQVFDSFTHFKAHCHAMKIFQGNSADMSKPFVVSVHVRTGEEGVGSIGGGSGEFDVGVTVTH